MSLVREIIKNNIEILFPYYITNFIICSRRGFNPQGGNYVYIEGKILPELTPELLDGALVSTAVISLV